MSVEKERPSGLAPAEALYVEFLAQAHSGVELEFESFCRLHPQHAAELRRIQAQPERLARMEREARSILGARSRDSSSREARFTQAEELLGQFFEQRMAAPEAAPSFESLLASHPELAHELGELWKTCGAVEGALGVNQEAFSAHAEHVQEIVAELRTLPGFDERYAVMGEIAQGGMGAILRVQDRKFGRLLAMKVVLGQSEVTRTGKTPPVEPHQLQRFLNEAKITANLDHPGIVPVHELGTHANGRAFFTMKLVQGRTLRDVFRLQAAGDPAWSRARVLSLFQRLCDAMAYAHERGVIHRDLKPANVMVGDFGEVYVMDWGLARRLDDAGAESSAGGQPDPLEHDLEHPRTREGAVLGTPAYMPPEQAAGRLHEIGPQSDVYAVGAMLYQLLAGHAPYCGPGEKSGESRLLRRIVEGLPSPLSSAAPPELAAISERAMARRPAERYPDMRALAADLGAYLEDRVVRAYRTGAWAEARTWIRRNRGLALASGAALLALVAGLATSMRLYVRAEESAQLARSNAALADQNAATARANAERASVNERAAQASATAAEAERIRAVESESHARREQRRAESETARAKAIQGFLERTIARADPTTAPADIPLRDVVLASAKDIDTSFQDQPEVRARLHLIVGDCLQKLSSFDEAESHGRAAIEAFAAVGLAESREAADAWYLCGMMAQFRSNKGKSGEEQRQRGIADLQESVRLYRLQPEGSELLVRRSEASIQFLQQLPTASDQALPDEFVKFVAGFWQEDDLDVARARLEGNMATISSLWTSGDRQAAKDFLRKDFGGYLGSSPLRRLAAGFLSQMGIAAEQKQRLPFAETCHSLAIDILAEAGDMPSPLGIAQANLAQFLGNRGRHAEAAEVLAQALGPLREALGPADADVVRLTNLQADLLLRLERFEEARRLLEEACEDARDEPKIPRVDLRHRLILHGLALEGVGRPAEGLRSFDEAKKVALPAKTKPRLSPELLEIHRGRVLARTGELVAAEELLMPLWEGLDGGEDKDLRRSCAAALGVFFRARGEPGEAEYFEKEAR